MELLVYKASAGSGKTFTLAVEYIKLLILNPRTYRNILAVTFTNKATGEMKERILGQLHGISCADPASDAYFQRIRADLKPKGMSETAIRTAAATALQYMLHDYSRFRVETIDSFYQSVMRNLARELELSPDLNIELNNKEVLSDAVDSLIEQLTPTSPVLAWMLDYINERINQDKRWNIAGELKKFGENIFDEEYMERGEELRRQLDEPNRLNNYRQELYQMEQAALKEMEAYTLHFEQLLSEHSIEPEELNGGSRLTIPNYFYNLRKGKLDDKIVNLTIQKCMNDASAWSTKTSKRRADIIQLAERHLIPLMQEAERKRPLNNRIINSCTLSLRHLNNLRLLNYIDHEVRRLNKQQNRFLLSDTNALLHRLVGDDDPSFVFEKIGANIRNVMIDEFQDTSRMQWENFRILLTEGLAQGSDSLIVGDVKQSIYRWRNGDWRILNELGNKKNAFPYPIRVETLKVNRRSESGIIEFNNRFFTRAVELLNERHLEELKDACLPLLRAYSDVAQESPRSEKRGYAKVSLLRTEKDMESNYTEQTLQALGTEVNRLLDSGIRQRDISILVRKNRNIPLIADYFKQEYGLTIVSDEAFRMDASQALCLMIEALRLLSDETDSIARAALGSNLTDTFVERMDALRLMPLYELLEELYSLLRLERFTGEDDYLFAFFDAVTEYLQKHSSDIAGFISYWNETLSAKTIPANEREGIRIMSIHKSKGLEFHTVLIPFCDWALENERNEQLVWCTPEEAPFNNLSLLPVNYSPAMADSVYRKEYLDERLQLWVDNLNLLYVAFTRAEKNLIVLGKGSTKNSVSTLLEQVLELSEEEDTYEAGSLMPSDELQETTANDNETVQMQSLHPDIEFKQSNRSADFIAGSDEADTDGSSGNNFIRRGQLLHTLFADIRTEADIEPAIQRLLFEGIIDSREMEQEIRKLTTRAFAQPQVKAWYSGNYTLMNERDIIRMEDGELHVRRPDRVMTRKGETIVVDFKFGKPQKKYHLQVQEYMQLLRQAGYPQDEIRGYLWYVEQGEVEEVNKQ
jgi:ATP-dependent exoDNAse (exonuclease V) beta subunit